MKSIYASNIIFQGAYRDYNFAIREIHNYYCAYVLPKTNINHLSTSSDSLDNVPCHCYVSWVGPMENLFDGKSCIGWDYGHVCDEEIIYSQEYVLADIFKVIDYLINTAELDLKECEFDANN